MMDQSLILSAATNAGTIPVIEPDAGYTWTQFISNSVLLAIVVLCAVLSFLFSFRYRRATDAAVRGLFQARMNISMGIMLIAIAIIQIFLFEANWLRSIIGAIFLLMGLFNLFAGIRNRRIFSQLIAKQQPRKS